MAGGVMRERTKIVGVLGGMGPDATVDFMSKVIALTPASTDQDHVRMLIDHNPKVPDRQREGGRQQQIVAEVLAKMAAGLEASGADFLVMPCNTSHAFLGQVLSEVSVPFVSIIDETVLFVGEAEPDASSVGILATDACLEAGLYQSALQDAGFSVLLPATDEQASVMQLISRIKSGDQGADVSHEMIKLANSLIQRGAGVVIAGCTEIPLVVSAEKLNVPFISSTDVLASVTVALCLGQSSLPAA